MNVQCEGCGSHFVLGPNDISGATACPDCGGTRFYRDQPSPTRSDGTLRNMVDSDSQKDQGGNPLGEGTIMGKDGERALNTGTRGRDNYMHSKTAEYDEYWPPRDHLEDERMRSIPENGSIPNTGNGLGCPNCGHRVTGDPGMKEIYCPNCDRGWPIHSDMPASQELSPADMIQGLYDTPDVPTGPWTQQIPKRWGRLAGEMEDILGLEPRQEPLPQGNFMQWEPGKQGRGLVINGEPHTWNVLHPDMVGDESHSGYVKKMGINPQLVNWDSQAEIHPSGEVEALAGRDPTPYFAADPRLKPLESRDIFSLEPNRPMTTASTYPRSLSMEPYTPWEHLADVDFDKGPDANVPLHKITVQPGPMGIHAGHTKYLRFLDASVNGIPARQGAGQIISRYGIHDSPEFGQPVEIGVHDPAHIPAIVEQLASGQGAIATPTMKELGHKIQSGQLPPPPGIDPATIAPRRQEQNQELATENAPTNEYATASIRSSGVGPQDALLAPLAEGAADVAGGGTGGMLGGVAPTLMKGALFRQGENMIGGGGNASGSSAQSPSGESGPPELSQISAILVSDYETPSSNPDVGVKHDDPEDVDQKEFNDQDKSPENLKNPNLDDSGASGEDGVRENAGFAPDSPGIERLGLLLPLVLHYFHSAESGADDPMIQGLHQVLEAENPGYLDRVTPEDEENAKQFLNQLGSKTHEKHDSKVALVPPMQPGGMMEQPMQPQPPVQTPPGGTQQQGHCPNCGGVLTADGSCPQCGAKANPMGGATMPGQTPMSGGPSMPIPYTGSIIAALVDSANHQGPVTPEQIAAVQQLLIKQHRINEVPNVPLNPGDYVKEMAEIQGNPNVAPQVPQGEQTSPPAPAGGAPGGMPMPGMGGGEAGGAPMQPMAHIAADNVAGRCPECNSASTGMLMDEGGHQHCHSCGHIWKNKDAVTDKSVNKETRVAGPTTVHPNHDVNPTATPAAEQQKPRDLGQEQDSSLSWQDSEGNPLQVGQEYEMHNPSYQIPDIVRVKQVKPDGLDVQIEGTFSNDPNSLAADTTISREDMELQNLTFTPSSENADDRNNQVPPGSQAPGEAQVPPSGQTTDEVANSYQQAQSSLNINHDEYFGGTPGSAQRALTAMQKEYGGEKGQLVYAALIQEKQAKSITAADLRHAEMLAASAQSDNPKVQDINQIPEFQDDDTCPKCGNRTIQSSMSSPTTMMHECFRCGNVWEVKDEVPDYDGGGASRSWVYESSSPGGDDFFAEMERARAMASAGMGSRSLSDIASKDTRRQQISEFLSDAKQSRLEAEQRTAGKKFTPSEQRALIDEDGTARNSDLLQLQGTHYRTRDDYTGKSNGLNVPDEHMIMGL